MRRKRSNLFLLSVVVILCAAIERPWVSGSPSENSAATTPAAADNERSNVNLGEACTESQQCATIDAVCQAGTCQCGADAPVYNIVGKCDKAQGNAKLNEPCTVNTDCRTNGAICENAACRCHPDLPASDNDNRCGYVRSFNQSCAFNEQCTLTVNTECVGGLCKCQKDHIPYKSDGVLQCLQRGDKKYGDPCNETLMCGYDGAHCAGNGQRMTCQCAADMPATDTIDKCGKVAMVNESCTFNKQCELGTDKTKCQDNRCQCLFEMVPVLDKDGKQKCSPNAVVPPTERHVDPAMIGVLVGMGLMFIILCVVLRLFSKARWRENRTIFNTPNPRLMNVSLLRDSKLLHGAGERRGSRASVRAPSRQPSMASLRPQSPSQSIGSRRSRGSSSPSVTSTKSPKSPTKQATNNMTNNTGASVLENVTVEVQDPKSKE